METQTLTYALLLLIGIFIGVAITGVLWLLSNEKQIKDSKEQLNNLETYYELEKRHGK
jgi:flagellar basal body-associated protein FliL